MRSTSSSSDLRPSLWRVLPGVALIAIAACSRSSDGVRPAPPGDPRAITGDAARPAGDAAVARPKAIALALGVDHSCALLADGAVRCWGKGEHGRLGLGDALDLGDDEPPWRRPPIDLGGNALAISAGTAHTCALLDGGRLRCWGRGRSGQLGYGRRDDLGDDETPAKAGDVPVGEPVLAVAAGGDATCALLAGDRIRCWGDNREGRLGFGSARHDDVGDDEPASAAVPFRFARAVRQLAASAAASCVLLDDGAVQCWGSLLGSEDDPAVAVTTPPVDVGAPVTALALPATGRGGCVITSAGRARCWGDSVALGLAFPDRDDDAIGVHTDMMTSPAEVGDLPLPAGVLDVRIAGDHGCARFADAIRCWGERRRGQLGGPPGDAVVARDAIAVDLGARPVAMAVASFHACAITDAGGVRCWGAGEHGRLGHGSTANLGDAGSPAAAGDVPIAP